MTEVIIQDSIPHRGPMLLLDRVSHCDTGLIVAHKRFDGDEFFFQGHYPNYPIVPGVILCECAAQAGAVLLANHHIASSDEQDKVPVLTRMNKVRFKKTVHPGEKIEIQVKLDEVVSAAYFLSAKIRADGATVATLELACALAPKSAATQSAPTQAPVVPKPKSSESFSQKI